MAGARGPIRGVNLGNWLVLERWMESAHTPGPFAGAVSDDEKGLRKELAEDVLADRLAAHRASYVTRDTFAWLERNSCNLVRLPVPFFVFGDETHESCIAHVDDAMDWAAEWGIPVLIDLHTVPGGQNGFDNGGASGLCTWHHKPLQVQQTLTVLEQLALRYANHPALFGMEPMNEPASRRIFAQSMQRYGADHPNRVERSTPIPRGVLAQFYQLVYERLRPILGPEVPLVFHDQFELDAWDRFMPAKLYPGVWIDTHQYVGTFARAAHLTSLRAHVLAARATGLRIARASRHHPVLVGEWSLTNNLKGLKKAGEHERDRIMRVWATEQMRAFEKGMGGCFWALRNGRYDTWSLEAGIRHGWIEF